MLGLKGSGTDVIGKEAKNVPEEEVKNYIFGYTIINDVIASSTS